MLENRYQCEECGAAFDNGVEWEQHKHTMHSRYTCETCHYTFGTEEEFEAHNFKMHPDLQLIRR